MVQPPAMMASQMSTIRVNGNVNGHVNGSSNNSIGNDSNDGSVPPQSQPTLQPSSNKGRTSIGIPPPPAALPPSSVSSAVPLSARRSIGLDLSTVEHRGHVRAGAKKGSASSISSKLGANGTSSSVEVAKTRLHGLKEAPTFRPSTEEWAAGTIYYINKIAKEGSKYGICKIIPPDGWNPPFAVFHFRTRKQELNQTDGGTRANLNYLDNLAKFHKQRSNTALNRFPSVDKRPLDLYKLKKYVEDKGGFDNVCKGKRWAEIGRDLGYSGKIMSSLSTSLKNSYQKWLQPYEDWLKENKPAVLQAQQERENGTPYTPSPGPISSLNTPRPSSVTAEPAIKASQILQAKLNDIPISDQPMPRIATPPPIVPPPSGFTAVNSGFTAVNVPPPSGFAAINIPSAHPMSAPSSVQPDTELTLSNGATSAPSSIAASGPVNGLKRQLSMDSDSQQQTEDGGRKSKRAKRDGSNAPTVIGSQMMQPRLPAPGSVAPRDRSNDQPGDGDEAGPSLVCDSCDVTYHKHCLDHAATTAASEGEWHCQRCLVGTQEYGFEEGGTYSLKQFQEKAQNFKNRHFAKKTSINPSTGKLALTEEEVEQQFWRLTESLTETVEVEYGADIHSTTHGSAFPTIEKHPFDPYSTDPWNLNVMPLDKDSLFT